MNIKALASRIFEQNKEQGWHDSERKPAEMHMLIVTEVAEATEEVRGGHLDYYHVNGKPMGEATEIADVIIRCLDYSELRGWNIESIILDKLTYNKTRGHKHGGKLF